MARIKCDIPKEYCKARTKDGLCALIITCKKLVPQCFGEGKNPNCSRIEGEYCRAYVSPESKWGNYNRETGKKQCPLADHLIKETKKKKIRSGGQKKWGRNR
jgi:hypothetical protein